MPGSAVERLRACTVNLQRPNHTVWDVSAWPQITATSNLSGVAQANADAVVQTVDRASPNFVAVSVVIANSSGYRAFSYTGRQQHPCQRNL